MGEYVRSDSGRGNISDSSAGSHRVSEDGEKQGERGATYSTENTEQTAEENSPAVSLSEIADDILALDVAVRNSGSKQIRTAVREEYKQKPVEPYTENIFKGKVFCPHCGKKPLHRQRNKRKTKDDVYFLHCLSRSRISKDACIGVTIDEQAVIEFVSDALKSKLSSLKEPLPQADKSDSLKRKKSDKQRELNRVQSLIRGLYENLVGGVISSEDYAELKSGYTSKSEELKAEIDAINSEMEHLQKQREQASETRDCAKLFRESKTLSAELLDRLVERIEISHDHAINVTFRGKESL